MQISAVPACEFHRRLELGTRVAGIGPGDDPIHQSDIFDGRTYRADGIHAGAKLRRAALADPPKGRLEPDQAT